MAYFDNQDHLLLLLGVALVELGTRIRKPERSSYPPGFYRSERMGTIALGGILIFGFFLRFLGAGGGTR